MRPILTSLSAAILFAMAGCASQQPAARTGSANPAATPAINAEAQAALSNAAAAVKEAKEKYALWTTAENALNAANEAAAKGDSEAVIKNAKTAEEQAHLGLEQAQKPPLELKNL